jgi:hypothetical protein
MQHTRPHRLFIQARARTHVHTHTGPHTRSPTHTHTHTHAHTLSHTHTRTTHTDTYTHTYTHTGSDTSRPVVTSPLSFLPPVSLVPAIINNVLLVAWSPITHTPLSPSSLRVRATHTFASHVPDLSRRTLFSTPLASRRGRHTVALTQPRERSKGGRSLQHLYRRAFTRSYNADRRKQSSHVRRVR